MRLPTRNETVAPTGVTGTLRTGRPTRLLLPRLRSGDIAVIDHVDLDRATAQAMVDAGVAAVVNAQPMSSGRFPNLGPQVLVEAGVLILDSVGEAGYATLTDGRPARIDAGQVYDGEQRLTAGRVVDAAAVTDAMTQARSGMLAQLETLTHTSTELLRREQGVLLHGVGLPPLNARITDRPVLVVAASPEVPNQLRAMRPYLREQRPVVVATATAATTAQRHGLSPAVIVLAAGDELPPAKVLRAARDVVVCGTGTTHDEALSRIGLAPARVDTTLAPADVAVLIAHAASPQVIVTAGLGANLADVLDRDREGVAGAYLARLAVGRQLIDAAAVPALYAGKVRVRHILLALLVCLVVVAAAIATTDVGHDWAHHLVHDLHRVFDKVGGKW
jgi:uncharacterized membrane-anchored protein